MLFFTRSVILAHRYLGIAISLLVVMWFVSGLVMMYSGGLPRLSPQLRLDRLTDLDPSRVRLTAEDAAQRAADEGYDVRAGGRVQLLTVLERPAYRVGDATVFADTGELFEELDATHAQAVASRFLRVERERVHFVQTIDRIDQWTLVQSRQMPLHKFRVDDADGSEVYVQASNGEVAQLTTRTGRALAWAGVIPHWLYFTALREHQPIWYRLVVWTSVAACLLSVLGLILSVTQFRRTRPFRFAKAVPYSGLMRWHYITGALFGVFTLTWAFSGLLSMEPFEWTNARGLELQRDVLSGGPVQLSAFGAIDASAWQPLLNGRGIKEVEFTRIQDEHYYVVRLAPADPLRPERRERLHQPYPITGRAEPNRLLVKAGTLDVVRTPFSSDSLLTRLTAALPDVPVVESTLLSDYDSYYYSRGRLTPLPVLRVKFADPAQTWVYIDPEMSQVLAQIHRLNRVERWLYNGLHSLDFAFWYSSRPLWDIGMITLLLGGLTTSSVGLVMGVRRMRRGAARAAAAMANVPPAPEGQTVTRT